jgi:Protein of unknown function (DUF998)
VATLVLAIALARLHPYTATLVVTMLVVSTAARFLIPLFPTDQSGSRFQTLPGTIHMLLAVVSFGGLVEAATSLWSTLRHYPEWHGAKTPLTILPWIMLGSVIALVVSLRGPRLKPVLGVFERLFYVSSIAWLFVVTINLARISG